VPIPRGRPSRPAELFRLVETRSALSPYQERELAVKIIQKLAAFHEDVIDGLIAEEKSESVAAWAMDLTRIRVAISLLEAVELSDD
jgi:predicted ArsR family transcriptional regulator